MALYELEYDIPYSKKHQDASRRREIFDIVTVLLLQRRYDHEQKYPEVADVYELAVCHGIMVRIKGLKGAKDYFSRYFPDQSAAPRACLGQKIGLSSG